MADCLWYWRIIDYSFATIFLLSLRLFCFQQFTAVVVLLDDKKNFRLETVWEDSIKRYSRGKKLFTVPFQAALGQHRKHDSMSLYIRIWGRMTYDIEIRPYSVRFRFTPLYFLGGYHKRRLRKLGYDRYIVDDVLATCHY